MSVLSLSYWESDVYWRQNNKHFAELAPQNGGKQPTWRNYVTVTLCIIAADRFVFSIRHLCLYGSRRIDREDGERARAGVTDDRRLLPAGCRRGPGVSARHWRLRGPGDERRAAEMVPRQAVQPHVGSRRYPLSRRPRSVLEIYAVDPKKWIPPF